MASNDKPPGRDDNNSSNDENPFVTFKKYADQQFASLFQNFIGLPSSTQLRDLEKSYFDENGRLKPISDLIDKAVEAVKTTEPRDRPTEPEQQLHRRLGTLGPWNSSFVSMLDEISMDPFERWQKHAERHAEELIKSAEADRCPYRPKEPEHSLDYPHRPACDSSARYDEMATITDAMGESTWSTNFFGKLSSSDHITTHRSFFGINSHTQNVPFDAWPLPYIAMSPYSPLAVENQLRKESERPNMRWRHAFEDLILLNKGYLMENMRNCNKIKDSWTDRRWQPAAPAMPGIQWVSGLISKGLFGDWRPFEKSRNCEWLGNNGGCKFEMSDESGMKKAWEMLPVSLATESHQDEKNTGSSHQGKEETEDDEVTELDLYEHFLENRNGSTSSGQRSPASEPLVEHPSHSAPTSAKAPTESSKTSHPSIISTLTTTERQVLPDGTVHTKVVLKKRFADGREESNEVEHTTHADSRAGDTRATNSQDPSTSAERAEVADEKKEQKPKRGWFW